MSSADVLFLANLVLIFSIIHDPADRGLGGRGHFHQVIALLLSLFKGVLGRQDAKLLPFRTDDPDFTNPNFSIDS